ncbi:hypothetical protein SAMN02745823_00982 [Sporobacter termitidis DSM 10068]|uniref:Uncharacterized protein n=1 Tax=Sporobacter termitidis DSM 10068 TaxID=1123282 RepID=A0A1M5VRN1_9FIRM|nr:hypothetical protein [Sporobacter termitidis]SHH77850.1 hypothetical protein SAMN02745823_00982 [Sporobacter termitidis DSM 10068]
MEQNDILLDDVKEYKPRKKTDRTSVRFMDNYNVSPDASAKLTKGEGLSDAVEELDSGVMLSTSEVLDFAEGTDSWMNQH